MTERNWYSSRLPSTAIVRPRSATRLVGWRTVIGVSKTPMIRGPIASHVMAFSPPRSKPRSGEGLAGRRRERPRVPVRCNRLEQRQGLAFRKGQEELPDVLAEILPVDELAPVLAVVVDRPRNWVDLHAVVLDPRTDRIAVLRNLDVPRIDSLRPIQTVPVHEPPERGFDKGVLRHVGAEVLECQRPEADLGGRRLLPEAVDSLQRARLLLGLDPEHAEDLDAILRRVPVEVVVEEPVHGLRLGGDLLDPRHPRLELLLRIAVIVPGILPMTVPAEVRHGGRYVEVRREEGLVHDRVRDPRGPEEVERLHRHPCLVARLEREREVPRKDVEEAVDRGLLEPKTRRELEQERSELPGVEEGAHQLAIGEEVLVRALREVEQPVVGHGLRDFRGKDEVLRRVPGPSQDHAGRWRAIERRVDLGGVENPRVRPELRFGRVPVHGTDPFLIVPTAATEPEADHRCLLNAPAIDYHIAGTGRSGRDPLSSRLRI